MCFFAKWVAFANLCTHKQRFWIDYDGRYFHSKKVYRNYLFRIQNEKKFELKMILKSCFWRYFSAQPISPLGPTHNKCPTSHASSNFCVNLALLINANSLSFPPLNDAVFTLLVFHFNMCFSAFHLQ